jgi:hypothetical protein
MHTIQVADLLEGVEQQLQHRESCEAGGGQKGDGMKHEPAHAVQAF